MKEVLVLFEKIKASVEAGDSEEQIAHWLLPRFVKDPGIRIPLAEHLARLLDPVAVGLLQRMLETTHEKPFKKAIKRSLYRLKSRGVLIEPARADRERPILRPASVEPPRGFGGGIDFLGQRLLAMRVPQPGTRIRVFEAVINDSEGLVAFSGGEIRRKEFEIFLKEAQRKSPSPLVEMEAPVVAFLLTEAYQLTSEKGERLPHGYIRFKSEIEHIRKNYERPRVNASLRVEEIADRDQWLERSGDLLKSDLFRDWRVGEERIRPHAEAVREAEESKIVLTKTQKEVRVDGIYQNALLALFPDEGRGIYMRRLEEMAYYLYRLGKQEQAKMALAAADDLKHPLSPFLPNPFLLELVKHSISLFLAERNREKAGEPSLILKP